MIRRSYLDWLRGLAVVIMIEAHTLDAWTRTADRSSTYGWAMVLAGYGAPFFMFLAGVGLALGAGSRERRGVQPAEIAVRARTRGWQILALAFLFRFQSWLVSGGPLRSMLKVDILNIMGVSMVAAGVLWGWGRSRWTRAALLVAAAVACTMVTPLVRATPLLAAFPDPLESYLRPLPGRTTFTLFPWAGFLLAGGAVGVWLDSVRTTDAERRATLLIGALGMALAGGGYAASFLPAIYPSSDYWTSSPTYFFVRLGVLLSSVPVAYFWLRLVPGWSPLLDFGRSSLFVYWVHVELVYGVVSRVLHRSLSFPAALVAFAVFTLLMLALVKGKERVVRRWQEGANEPGLSAAGAG